MTAHIGSLTAGTKLWRIHSGDPNRDVLTLNPTPAGATGGRFDSSDGSYHYSYFGEDISTCIAETYCRSLPLDDHIPRILRKAKLAGRVLSQVTVTDDVPVALVHGSHSRGPESSLRRLPGLRVTVPGRAFLPGRHDGHQNVGNRGRDSAH
ncbi:RES family NAD+ phosphorylase [Rhodococcus opacus]|uniref:RES family NAD+ phosphorylase n=1 Tax=Rhodococcus opacus TaxID=37919 RepID=UPI0029532673|nr:RES family NAD+ phosphorylase [Rhodococcus opacus]MDV7088992.1 RES family NAD+ phosphorylase [Rhodococcus opacus]